MSGRIFAWLKTDRGLIVLALVVGLGLRLLAQPLHPFLGDDSDDYGAFAQGLRLLFAGGDWRETPAVVGGYGYSPGYPLTTAIFSYVTGNIWVSARVISLLTGLAVIYATYVFGRDLFGVRAGLLAGWVVALSSVMVGQSARVASEMIFVLSTLLALIMVFRAMRESDDNAFKSRLLWGAGLSIGFAALTRPEGFVIGAVIVVVLVWTTGRFRPLAPLLIPVGLLIVVWAWSGFLGYFVDHYRGVNSAIDAGLSFSQFGVQVASQSFHLASGMLTALGIVVVVLAAVGAWVAIKSRESNQTALMLLLILAADAAFLVATPGLLVLDRYLAVMIPIWAIFAGRGMLIPAGLLRSGGSAGVLLRRSVAVATILVVASVFNARSVGDVALTYDYIAGIQSTTQDWLDDQIGSEGARVFDQAGIAQLRFVDGNDKYEIIAGKASELSSLDAGYDFIVVQQPIGQRHKLPDQYDAVVDITADPSLGTELTYTVYAPAGTIRIAQPIQLRSEKIETVWDRFWSIR